MNESELKAENTRLRALLDTLLAAFDTVRKEMVAGFGPPGGCSLPAHASLGPHICEHTAAVRCDHHSGHGDYCDLAPGHGGDHARVWTDGEQFMRWGGQ